MLLLRAAACAGACAALVAAAGAACIPAPPDLTWAAGNRGYLEFVPYTIQLASGTIRTRAWKDSLSQRAVLLPPPILRLKRGESYSVVVRNGLPEGPTSTAHNTLKDPNIFNLHTHGLHISGEMPADDVWRAIGFQECAEYVYHLPTEHLGGTHFYHPHHHGSTFLHIAGGAMGMIIVEDDAADLVPPKVMAMSEQHLILSHLDRAGKGAGGDTIFWHNNDGFTKIAGGSHWTVNGVEEGHGEICIPPNTWQRWRVMLFDQESNFWKFGFGAYDDRSGASPFAGAPCEMMLMARDGIWRSVTPKLLSNSYFMPASSRADVAVRCSASASFSVAHWNRDIDREGPGNEGGLDKYSFLANVVVDPSLPADTESGPFSEGAAGTTWSARKPVRARMPAMPAMQCPLARVATCKSHFHCAKQSGVVSRALLLARSSQDYAPGDLAAVDSTELAHSEFYGLTQTRGFTVNTGNPSEREVDNTVYQKFSKETPNAQYTTGGVYEFKPLKSGDHSFHLHIWPLQAISFLSNPTSNCLLLGYEVGEYYDVWRCEGVARWKAVRFAGKAVHHCHMVRHEDTGLMGWFNFSGPAEAYEPNPCPQNNLYKCSDPFTGHTACAAIDAPKATPTDGGAPQADNGANATPTEPLKRPTAEPATVVVTTTPPPKHS